VDVRADLSPSVESSLAQFRAEQRAQIQYIRDEIQSFKQEVQLQLNRMDLWINHSFQTMNILIHNEPIKRQNYVACKQLSEIFPISDNAGNTPSGFPKYRGQLFCIEEHMVVQLLRFYGLSVEGDIHDKRNRLALHVGMRLE
jgi:hypothetical protein